MNSNRGRLVAAAAIGGMLVAGLSPGYAFGSVTQPSVVSANADNSTPELVATAAVPRPHVDAVGALGNTMIAGGLFDTVEQGGDTDLRKDLVAFDALTGDVSTEFDPTLAGGQVWAIVTNPATNSVYVAGQFTSVDGGSQGALVKLNGTTGAVDTSFKPPFKKGRITDLEFVTAGGADRLIVAANMGKRLFSLNPTTGADDGYIHSTVAGPIAGAWGGLAVYQVAVDPSGTHLVATGNFTTVNGAARKKFFMLELGPADTTLSEWYYPGFAKDCSTTAPRRIANLQGLDWSPDGSAFNVVATGQIPLSQSDIWYERLGDDNQPNTTVCDGVGRFNLSDDTKPAWINYTGGDSMWTVSDTGAAVYVQGHFKWVNNPDGWASKGLGDKTSGAPAVGRTGIAAIDPDTGLADPWNPGVTSKTGGKALLATLTGLWAGGDSVRFGSEQHYGIAFAPLL